MLEIIAIIFLSRKNGFLAESKGLKSGTWIRYTVLAWIGFEFAGALIGMILFGPSDMLSIYLLAIASAVMGYFVIRDILLKKPFVNNDDTDNTRTRVDDLYPDRNKN
ncbi:hypothetical protein [Ferruginibacter sp.]